MTRLFFADSWGAVGGMPIIFILVIVLVRKVYILSRQKRYQTRNGCMPVQRAPCLDPILGIDIYLRVAKYSREHEWLNLIVEDHRVYQNTFRASVLGQGFIITIEPENIKAVLSTKFQDFSLGNREETLGPLLGKGIFNSDGETWTHSRAMIRPNFARDQIADLDAFEAHMQIFLQCIPRDQSTFDLQDLFFRYTIDSATEFLFGKSVDTLREKLVGSGQMGIKFAQAFNTAQDACQERMKMGSFHRLYYNRKADEAIKFCHQYVDDIVSKAIKNQTSSSSEKTGSKYVFLEQLIQATKDPRRLRDETLNVLLAGRDTTAGVLSNLWFELAKQPAIFHRLRQEITRELDGKIPSYEQLRNLKYLKYCLNEALRLYPSVPVNVRLALRDTHLPTGGGPDGKSPAFVPKGHIVSYSVYAMHRREDLYGPDASIFRPERWESLRTSWDYLPFNGGPRICLGQQYALTEASFVTVRLLQEFKDIESRDVSPWKESLSLTLSSLYGTKVGLTPA